MAEKICIYHGSCLDGQAAAWVVWKAFDGDVDLVAGVYQQDPPDVTGKDVYIVDFSYKRDVIKKMAETAASIHIIDHHKTAITDLAGIDVDIPYGSCPVITLFNEGHSGCVLAWISFFNGDNIPQALEHIEDRDLWRFSLSGTKEICAALFSYSFGIKFWDGLMERHRLNDLRREGEAILRQHNKHVSEMVKLCQRNMKIAGHIVPVASLPPVFSSNAGHIMAEEAPFAACYYDVPDGRCFSLRSRNSDGLDVSEIARKYGGGGHKHAAGFMVDYQTARQFEL